MEDNKKMKFKVEIIEILQYQEVIEDKDEQKALQKLKENNSLQSCSYNSKLILKKHIVYIIFSIISSN